MALTIRDENIINEIKNLQEIFQLKTATQVIDKLTQINIAYNELYDNAMQLKRDKENIYEMYRNLKLAVKQSFEANETLKELV